MVFNSILWSNGQTESLEVEDPDFFVDLNIDQIINGIIDKNKDYDLRPLFDTTPESIDTVRYRQDIFKDLQNPVTLSVLKEYSMRMRSVYAMLSGHERLYQYQKQGWHLDAALMYFDSIQDLAKKLGDTHLDSQGLTLLRDYVQAYVSSKSFMGISEEARRVKAKLSTI